MSKLMPRKAIPALISILALILVVALILPGCAGLLATEKGEESLYSTLYIAGVSRDALLTKAGQYYRMGMIDEGTKEKILEADEAAQTAAQAAIAALEQKLRLEALEGAPPEAIEAAKKAYDEAAKEFDMKWKRFTALIEVYMAKWLIEK